MRRLTIFSALAAGILALAPFSAALAAQSPQYMSSEPTNGAELHEAPEVVKVAFTEPLDASSELRVFACGTRVDDGKTTVSLNQMEVGLASGPTGIYQARWVAEGLGGVTGSSAGFIEFSVGHGEPSCDGGHGSGHGSGHGGGEGHGGEGGHMGEGHGGSGTGHGGGSHSEGTHGSGSSHSETDHSGSSHSSTSGHSSSGHSGGGGHGSSDHGSDKGHGEGHGSNKGGGAQADTEEPTNPDLAAGEGPLPIPTPEAGAILLALAACIGLGVTGGWLARLV